MTSIPPEGGAGRSSSVPIARGAPVRYTFTFLFRAVILSALLIALIEIVLARTRPIEIPVHNELYPYVMFRPPANATWRSATASPSSRSGEHAVEYTSAESFRVDVAGRDVPKHKPDDVIRIVMLGGSTVRMGSTFEVTLPGSLRTILEKRHPAIKFEVINAGITSAISRQELAFLITVVVDYKPDIVIIYDGINDSGQMLYYEDRPDFPYNHRALESAWQEYVIGRSTPLWRLSLHRSAILERLFPNRFGKRSVLRTVDAVPLIENVALRRTYAEAHAGNWEKMWHVARVYDIRPVFVLQPTSLYPEFAAGRIGPDERPPLYANYLIYQEMRRVTRELVARVADFRLLDLSDFLPSDAFYDGAHVYDDVNSEIATRIAEFIDPDIDAVRSGPSIGR